MSNSLSTRSVGGVTGLGHHQTPAAIKSAMPHATGSGTDSVQSLRHHGVRDSVNTAARSRAGAAGAFHSPSSRSNSGSDSSSFSNGSMYTSYFSKGRQFPPQTLACAMQAGFDRTYIGPGLCVRLLPA